MGEIVRLERHGAVGVVRLDRPPVNALNAQLIGELDQVVAELAGSTEVRAVVVYGGEKTFSAGADIEEMAQGGGPDILRRIGYLQRTLGRLEDLPLVTMAAITGHALGGGCEIALACDFRFASDRAKLGQPEILLGLIPGAGGTQRLPRLIGPARAKRMIYTGEMVSAEQALGWGLVDEVAPADEIFDRTVEAATRYAAGPTVSIAAAKRAIDKGLDGSLAAGLEVELQAFAGLFQTEDTRHGLESFLEHGPGKARFTGR